MDSVLLQHIETDLLKKLFLSDDLTTEFINNKEYSSNQNVINVATVLLSYYMHMNDVNNMLSDYKKRINKTTLSNQEKADIELRIQLLTYVSKQKEQIDKVDNNKIINSILYNKGKKSRRKSRRKSSRKSSRKP